MKIPALIVVLALAVAGCGSSKPQVAATSTPPAPVVSTSATSNPPSTATDPSVELRAAVQAYSDAFLTGKGAAAYALLSKRCKDRTSESEFSGMVDQAAQMYGDPLPFKSFEPEISGDLARVTYTYTVSAINQNAEPWVRESGHWYEDDC